MTISVCMIVKNEAKVIARALRSVLSFADEIILVDTQSSDSTLKIAKNFPVKIYHFPWCDDFSKARNFSFSKATKDFILWLDADDYIPLKEQQKIIHLKSIPSKSAPDCIMTNYYITPNFFYPRERILRNHFGFVWEEPVHEVITPKGNIAHLNINIYHKKISLKPSSRNLKIYTKLKKSQAPFSPRAMYYYARELYFHKFYKSAIIWLNKFLKTNGWIQNKIDACHILSDCYLNLNDFQKALTTLLKTLSFSPPSAKTCCYLANIFFIQNDLNSAIYWYTHALTIPTPTQGWIEPNYNTLIPALQLCVCYFHKKDYKTSYHYHKLSQKFNPSTPQVLHNKNFFKSFLGSTQTRQRK